VSYVKQEKNKMSETETAIQADQIETYLETTFDQQTEILNHIKDIKYSYFDMVMCIIVLCVVLFGGLWTGYVMGKHAMLIEVQQQQCAKGAE
jgi:hypothetical protein